MTDSDQVTGRDWVNHIEQVLKTGTTRGIGEADERLTNRPLLLFTVTGAKSGEPRYVALMRVEKNGKYAMIASSAGADKDPQWAANVRANHEVIVQDGEKLLRRTAREVHGEEREEWWQNGVEAYPHYTTLQSYTDRKIPVFVLE